MEDEPVMVLALSTSMAQRPEPVQRALDAVRLGGTATLEVDGEQDVAVLDLVDYRILWAAAHNAVQPSPVEDPAVGLADEKVASLSRSVGAHCS